MNPEIKSVQALEPYRLRTIWSTGEVLDVDVEPILRQDSALKEILKPEVFATVHTDGFSLEWLDTKLCPDAVYRLAKEQASDENIVLTRRESLRILELIENPPPMNEKLKQLMAKYKATPGD